jgi:hypothetical protein
MIEYLEKQLSRFTGKNYRSEDGLINFETSEGVGAVMEAIEFLDA